MKFYQFIAILSAIFMTCNPAKSERTESPIKLGQCEVTVEVTGFDTDGLELRIETSPIFSGFDETDIFPLEKIGQTIYKGVVDLEQHEELVGLIIGDTGFMTLLRQGENADLKLQLTPEREFVDFRTNVAECPSIEGVLNLDKAFMTFLAANNMVVPTSLYSDWREVQDYKIDTMLAHDLNAISDIEIPDYARNWFLNSLKMRFASLNYTPYTAIAQRMNHLQVEEPPMEAYSWLGTLDYSDNMLRHIPIVGLKPFLSTIVRFAGGGLTPIGDTPVDEWKEYAAQKLSPAIPEPTPLLLDLLSAMSYVLQIDNQQPLSPAQIQNISNGYDSDLGKIILNRNDKLTQALQQSADKSITDLTDQSFSLKQYIDSNFAGRPVIVDTWNTWCSPCLSAIKLISTFKHELPDDIVFLYVSDTSSELKDWERIAPTMHGHNVRINKEDAIRMGREYSLTGFPSYIFFNSEHAMTESMTGFPGIETFKTLADRI